jgi:hypothetical protein
MSLEDAPRADVDGVQDCGNALPTPGAIIITACGGRINYSADIPCALYHGELLYF